MAKLYANLNTRRFSGVFIASLLVIVSVLAGLGFEQRPAHAATVSATISPAPTAVGWNASAVTFSITTQTSLSTFNISDSNFSIDSSNTTTFRPLASCMAVLESACTGVAFSVTAPGGVDMPFSNAKLTAATGGFSVQFGENNTIPVGSILSIVFDANTVYFNANSIYYMVSATYGNPSVDRSLTATIFNSVTYHTNYATDVTSVQGGLMSAPLSYVPSRSGYVFQGWSLTSGGSVTYSSGATFNFSSAANTHLYAIWTVASQTVTFDANGGTGTMANQTASTTTNLTSNSFTRAGYTFAGWADAANGTGTQYANGASYAFTISRTIYAKWTGNPNIVTYDSHGGSGVADGSFLSGGTIATLPASPTRAGYSFNGWFAAASGGPALANGYAPAATSAITLHAQWTGTTNTVTYDSHGGNSVSAGSFVTGGTIANLAVAPTRAGYSFAGWFVSASGGSALADGYAPSATSAITLHAQWNALAQTVTFNANGGTGSMTAQTSGSSAVLTTNTISRAGYGFTGWNTASNGSGTAYALDATHPFTSSETLYAQWRALPATPVAAVDIQVPVGSAIANAPVDLDVDGLKDQTGYTVTVFSTPQIIDQGTIWSGRLNTTVRIPSNLEAGWHRLVIVGTAADGTPWTEENFFKVSPGGILLATSEVVPAELAMTGSKAVPAFYGAGFLILLGFGFLAANVTLRRRNNK